MVGNTSKGLSFCLAAAFLTMVGISGVCAGDVKIDKIVTVNTKQIIRQHPAFIKAQQTLQREAQQIRQQMKGKGQQEQQAAQQQLQQRARELREEALNEVRKDIQKIADDKGYKYVMDANVLLAGGEDVTDEIMQEIGKTGED